MGSCFSSLCVERGLGARWPWLAGTLPVAGVASTPLANALGVGGALEVVGVGGVAEPLGLPVTLAGLAAVGFAQKHCRPQLRGSGRKASLQCRHLGERRWRPQAGIRCSQ